MTFSLHHCLVFPSIHMPVYHMSRPLHLYDLDTPSIYYTLTNSNKNKGPDSINQQVFKVISFKHTNRLALSTSVWLVLHRHLRHIRDSSVHVTRSRFLELETGSSGLTSRWMQATLPSNEKERKKVFKVFVRLFFDTDSQERNGLGEKPRLRSSRVFLFDSALTPKLA